MNKLSKHILLILTLALTITAVLAAGSKVKAQSEIPLTVAPARQFFNIDPGTTEHGVIKFLNQSSVPLSGNIKAVDFIVSDNQGSPILLEDNTFSSKYSGASWINLPYDRATIAANDILKVQFNAAAPTNARPGGRYVAIYFEPTGSIPSGQDVGFTNQGVLATTSKIVGLLYFRVNGPITEQAIIKTLVAPKFVEYGPIEVEAEILNRGDYHITPTGQVRLVNWFGKLVDQQPLDEKNIFPDTSRIYNFDLGGKYLIGKYKVELLTTYGESPKPLTGTVSFWAFPWRLALVIVLSIIIIILVSVIIWKALKGKQTKLEDKLEKEIDELESLKDKYRDPNPSHKAK